MVHGVQVVSVLHEETIVVRVFWSLGLASVCAHVETTNVVVVERQSQKDEELVIDLVEKVFSVESINIMGLVGFYSMDDL